MLDQKHTSWRARPRPVRTGLMLVLLMAALALPVHAALLTSWSSTMPMLPCRSRCLAIEQQYTWVLWWWLPVPCARRRASLCPLALSHWWRARSVSRLCPLEQRFQPRQHGDLRGQARCRNRRRAPEPANGWRTLGGTRNVYIPARPGQGVLLSERADGVVVADAIAWVGPLDGRVTADSAALSDLAAAQPLQRAVDTATNRGGWTRSRQHVPTRRHSVLPRPTSCSWSTRRPAQRACARSMVV